MADAMHTQSDVLTSCAVLVSLVGVRLGYPVLDPSAGWSIAVFIARTGLADRAGHVAACCPTGSCSPKTTSAES